MSEIHFCKDCQHFNQFDATCKTRGVIFNKITGEEARLPCILLREGDTCPSYREKARLFAPPTRETIKRKSPLFGWIYNLLKGT